MAQAAPALGVRHRARNSQVLPPQHETAAAPLPSERPAYPRGTRVYASCPEYDVTGPLVVDHEDLDGIVSIYRRSRRPHRADQRLALVHRPRHRRGRGGGAPWLSARSSCAPNGTPCRLRPPPWRPSPRPSPAPWPRRRRPRVAMLAAKKDLLATAAWVGEARDLADVLLLAEVAWDLWWGVGVLSPAPGRHRRPRAARGGRCLPRARGLHCNPSYCRWEEFMTDHTHQNDPARSPGREGPRRLARGRGQGDRRTGGRATQRPATPTLQQRLRGSGGAQPGGRPAGVDEDHVPRRCPRPGRDRPALPLAGLPRRAPLRGGARRRGVQRRPGACRVRRACRRGAGEGRCCGRPQPLQPEATGSPLPASAAHAAAHRQGPRRTTT